MKVFYSNFHLRHNPPFEVLDGGEKSPSFEIPDRVENIHSELIHKPWAEFSELHDFGLEPILDVHDKGYVDFLRTAFQLWTAGDEKFEHVALTPATFPPGGRRRIPHSVLGQAGYYMMDLSAPIGVNTYLAAYHSAQCALSGAFALQEGNSVAYALCRPPGHHSGTANCGGYCYLNNAAIAANRLAKIGSKVSILDIDYHAGNGTQEIFFERNDVYTISIHADPNEEYPYYWGYQDEVGHGPGYGFHRNYPLPIGTDDKGYLRTLDQACGLITSFSPRYLVVSLGLDLASGDPLGKFHVSDDGIEKIGQRINDLNLPTLIVQEGGYDIPRLGSRATIFLENFAGKTP